MTAPARKANALHPQPSPCFPLGESLARPAMANTSALASEELVDRFGRHIDYIRLSITDRCNLRCRYCMAEDMEFLPRRDLLTIEELAELGSLLVQRGIRHIRLTGGEPLVRRGVLDLARRLGGLIGKGLDELTMTTNGMRLPAMAGDLFDAGIRRINISLDTLDAGRFAHITRGGRIDQVFAGIEAAQSAGLALKLNMVAIKGFNEDEFVPMLRWAGDRGCDLSLIETMPLGRIEGQREDSYLPLAAARDAIERHFTLVPSTYRSAGPARYFDIAETGSRLGLITPLSANFCAGCNRVRITATGTIYGCLGHDQHVELRDLMRTGDAPALHAALDRLIAGKPQRHEFDIHRAEPAVTRHMSVTGG